MFKKKKKIDELIFDTDLIGCIGKLPIHREFIKHRVTLPEIANLDQWYQNAYHHVSRQYGNEFKNIFSQMPLHHFVYTSPERLPMIGTVIASHDQSERAYPFVIFRLLEHPFADEFWSLIPMTYQKFFSMTQEVCNISVSNYSLPDLYKKTNELNQTLTKISRRDVLEMALTPLQKMTLNDFKQMLQTIQPNINFEFFVLTLFQQLQVFKTRVLQNEFVGLRLPIMSGN